MELIFIFIFLLKITCANAASIIVPPLTNVTSFLSPNRISFADAVTAGVLSTTARYSTAIFVEIQATTKMNPTTNPRLLTDVRLIFTIADRPPNRVVYTQMKRNAWGQWGEPYLDTSAPPTHLGAMPLPIGMDIVEADRLIKAAGYWGRYWAVDVRWPLDVPAAESQLFYFFEMEGSDPDVVVLATRDRTVRATYSKEEANQWLSGNGLISDN